MARQEPAPLEKDVLTPVLDARGEAFPEAANPLRILPWLMSQQLGQE